MEKPEGGGKLIPLFLYHEKKEAKDKKNSPPHPSF